MTGAYRMSFILKNKGGEKIDCKITFSVVGNSQEERDRAARKYTFEHTDKMDKMYPEHMPKNLIFERFNKVVGHLHKWKKISLNRCPFD